MPLPIGGSFLRHRASDIPRWARSLNHVRFCHPADRMVLDREIFLAAVEIPKTEASFNQFCENLGIPVIRIGPDDAVARVGVAYKPDVWRVLKRPIEQFPNLAQPDNQIVAGVEVRLWVRERSLEFIIPPAVASISVDENDFQRAKAIDTLLSRPGLQFIDPPRDDESCVSPKYYPQYW